AIVRHARSRASPSGSLCGALRHASHPASAGGGTACLVRYLEALGGPRKALAMHTLGEYTGPAMRDTKLALRIRKTPAGKGVFALRKFRKNQRIGTMT